MQYVAVNRSGVVFEYAGGQRDAASGRAVTSDTTFMAYSMSKTITAVAVLQLAEAGQVGIDDPVDRYVEAARYGPEVTLRRMLSHTAGLPNPIPLRWVHEAGRHAKFDADAAFAEVLRKYPRASSTPGARYHYSNIGYWLLGAVVERASGQRFTDYVETHILRPLQLQPADLGYTVVDPERQATGHLERYSLMNLVKGLLIDPALVGESTGRWVAIRPHYVNGAAFGGLVGTARAFGRFLQDQLGDVSVVLRGEGRRLLYDSQAARSTHASPMTLGWHVAQVNGHRCFYKEGGGAGFHCLMRLYPDLPLGTVIMTNATAAPVHRMLDETDRMVMLKLGTQNLEVRTQATT
jgi:CubicO group peptidase (beta-lactamase class C family)